MRKYSLLAFVLVCFVGGPAHSQEILWKFPKKDGKLDTTPFYQTMKVDTEQKLTVTGKTIDQTQAQTFYFKWTPKEEKDGKVTLEAEIVGLKMNLKIGETVIEYDSQSKKDGGALKDFFKTLLGAKFTMTIDPKKPEVVEIKEREELIKKLIQQNPNMKELLDKVLSDEALREMIGPMFLCTPPDGKIPEKKEWSRTVNLDMGAIGKYVTTYKYVHDGKDGDNEKIKLSLDLKYNAPGQSPAGGKNLVFVIKEANLKSSEGSGQLLFNSKLGRLTELKYSLKLAGTLKIEIAGQVTEVTIDQQKQTVEVTVSTKDPIAKSS